MSSIFRHAFSIVQHLPSNPFGDILQHAAAGSLIAKGAKEQQKIISPNRFMQILESIKKYQKHRSSLVNPHQPHSQRISTSFKSSII